MTDTTTTVFPDLVIEIHRYDADKNGPDTFRFFYVEPHEVDTSRLNFHPFATGTLAQRLDDYEQFKTLMGPNYCEAERHQVSDSYARLMRYYLEKDGYTPMSYEAVPRHLAQWAAHSQAPIEFHRGLDAMDPEVTKRVVIWVRGELPS